MKKLLSFFSLIATTSCILLMQGCMKDTLTSTYVSFEPVYKSKTEVIADIKSGQPQGLGQTGKLALYGNYIFVNEVNKGVHVIDNSNPAVPRNIAFINIPGNVDLAIKDNMLYADIYTDMVTIDVSDPHNAVLKKISYNIFPEREYPGGFVADATKYIAGWIRHESREKIEIDQHRVNVLNGVWMEGDATAQSGSFSNTSSAPGKSNSIGGSMARFTVVNDHLYTVGRASLSTFNVSNAADPVMLNAISLGWNIETIYPLNNKLFIGSQTGMFIFNIDNPALPSMMGTFSHACFGDPVIANDRYAFVTLKAMTNASQCWGVAPQRNEMDIVDISNILQPTLLKVYDMAEPQGLSLDGDHLFVCDGKGGLKVFDAGDVTNLRPIITFTDINPFDVIAYNGIAIVVSKEGITQYDYSNINNVRKLSTIAVNN